MTLLDLRNNSDKIINALIYRVGLQKKTIIQYNGDVQPKRPLPLHYVY